MKDRNAERVTRETAGRPTVLCNYEEQLIMERLQTQGHWVFPLTYMELCAIIKGYLDSLGRTIRFMDNMPSLDFVACFLRHYRVLTVRRANTVKRIRAADSHETVKDCSRFSKTVKDIPLSNIFNYDETNHQDNPGCVKAIFKKATKYAEHLRNHLSDVLRLYYQPAVAALCCLQGKERV